MVFLEDPSLDRPWPAQTLEARIMEARGFLKNSLPDWTGSVPRLRTQSLCSQRREGPVADALKQGPIPGG